MRMNKAMTSNNGKMSHNMASPKLVTHVNAASRWPESAQTL